MNFLKKLFPPAEPINYETVPLQITKVVFSEGHSLYIATNDSYGLHLDPEEPYVGLRTYGPQEVPLYKNLCAAETLRCENYRTVWVARANVLLRKESVRYLVDLRDPVDYLVTE